MGHPTEEEKIATDSVWKYAVPKGCHLPGDWMWMVQMDLAERLQVQMSLDEIEAGYRETDPMAVAKLRNISCRGCNMSLCPHRPQRKKHRRS